MKRLAIRRVVSNCESLIKQMDRIGIPASYELYPSPRQVPMVYRKAFGCGVWPSASATVVMEDPIEVFIPGPWVVDFERNAYDATIHGLITPEMKIPTMYTDNRVYGELAGFPHLLRREHAVSQATEAGIVAAWYRMTREERVPIVRGTSNGPRVNRSAHLSAVSACYSARAGYSPDRIRSAVLDGFEPYEKASK